MADNIFILRIIKPAFFLGFKTDRRYVTPPGGKRAKSCDKTRLFIF